MCSNPKLSNDFFHCGSTNFPQPFCLQNDLATVHVTFTSSESYNTAGCIEALYFPISRKQQVLEQDVHCKETPIALSLPVVIMAPRYRYSLRHSIFIYYIFFNFIYSYSAIDMRILHFVLIDRVRANFLVSFSVFMNIFMF